MQVPRGLDVTAGTSIIIVENNVASCEFFAQYHTNDYTHDQHKKDNLISIFTRIFPLQPAHQAADIDDDSSREAQGIEELLER